MEDEKPRGSMLSLYDSYYGDPSGTRTRIGRFRDVRITNHALGSFIYMVLTLGFEPSLADPQSAVLTNNTKLGWCQK